MIALASIGRTLWSVLTFGITLPVWIFLAAWLFFQWDKSQAVKDAVADLVAHERIAGLEAQITKERALRALVEGKRQAAEAANKAFYDRALTAQLEQGKLEDEVEDLKRSAPVCSDDSGGFVDQRFIDRLRKR